MTLYATFDEYGSVDSCSIRRTEQEAREYYEREVAVFKERFGVSHDGGLCLGRFPFDKWREIGTEPHKYVEYIDGFRKEAVMTDEDVIYLMYSELVYRQSQVECGCKHPACEKCLDDLDTRNAIRLAQEQWPEFCKADEP